MTLVLGFLGLVQGRLFLENKDERVFGVDQPCKSRYKKKKKRIRVQEFRGLAWNVFIGFKKGKWQL